MHGQMHDPISRHVSWDLLNEGGQVLALGVCVKAKGGLQRPCAIGTRLNGPHAVFVGHLQIGQPLAIGLSVHEATEVTGRG